jgi:AcrR family transcriptional regulator
MSEDFPLSAYRLPPGRHGLPPDLVAENQRWRLLVGSGQALAASGYDNLTSRDISRRASVSSGTFYRHFENVDACLLAAHAVATDCLWELIGTACTGAGTWLERLRASLLASADFLVSEPAFARLLCADVEAGIPAVAEARRRFLERLADLLCAGRGLRPETADRLPQQVEVHLTAATASLLGDRIAAGELAALPSLSPELAEILVAPYKGIPVA